MFQAVKRERDFRAANFDALEKRKEMDQNGAT
jgi:hypothetical protein